MTMFFRGRYSQRLDPKGRISLPSAFRHLSKEPIFYITNSIHHGQKFLDVFSEKEWMKFEKKLAQMPLFDADLQSFRRFYLSSAVPIQMDAQGRLLVPLELREFARLDEEIVLLGAGHKFEVWPHSAWKKFQDQVTGDFDKVLRVVANYESGEKT